MTKRFFFLLWTLSIGCGMKALAGDNVRMLWGSINGTANAAQSTYAEYNNIILLSWRKLQGDNASTSFDLYRSTDGGEEVKLNENPIKGKYNWQDKTADRTKTNTYRLTLKGSSETIGTYTMSAAQASAGLPYIQIDLRDTKDVCALDTVWYEANDASVGDLDGDGMPEVVIKRLLTHGKDGKVYEGTAADDSPKNVRHTVLYEAYKLDGTFMWRICSGPNILLGNSSSFAIADYDGDGKCEMAIKTGEGTVFGDGQEIGDTDGDGITDYRGLGFTTQKIQHYIAAGPEFFSVVDGTTGKELARADYITRGKSEDWGDDYFKRASSLRVAVANFDGLHPSILLGRGVYERSVLEAWDYRGGQLTRRWHFDSAVEGTGKDGKPNSKYASQGFHSLSVGDVDGDGYDEVVYGSMTIDHDGQGLYTSEYGHGDALHLGKFDPSRDGMQIWSCQEFGKTMAVLRDARTGETIWKVDDATDNDTGRAMIADIDPEHPGCEAWFFKSGLYTVGGEKITDDQPGSCNMAIWFGSGLNRQLLNGTTIHQHHDNSRIFTVYRYDVSRVNGTKENPSWYGDLLGDWREEIIFPDATRTKNIKIFSTWYPTEHAIPYLMSDHVYEMSALNQNVGYNMPTQTGFYLGSGMEPFDLPISVNEETTWGFDGYMTGTATTITEQDKLYTRATATRSMDFQSLAEPVPLTFSDGKEVTVNKIATTSAKYSVTDLATMQADDEDGEKCTPFFAFNTTVPGTCYVYAAGERVTGNKLRIYYTDGVASVNESLALNENVQEVRLTASKGGTFFIGGIMSNVRRDIYAIHFVPGDGSEAIGTTGIAPVDYRQSSADGVYYNLQGHSVARPAKGLYIVNGKKIIKK